MKLDRFKRFFRNLFFTKKEKYILCFVGFIFLACFQIFSEVPVPKLQTRVTDLTRTLTNEEISELEDFLQNFENKKGSQVAVLIIPSTEEETIEEFSIRVVENWKIGRKKIDDGVLLLVAKNDRKLRIEVGRGLEGALTDALSKRIIEEIIKPEFKKGQFFVGVKKGLSSITKIIEGEKLPEFQGATSTQKKSLDTEDILLIKFIAVIIGCVVIRIFFGLFKGALIVFFGFLAYFVFFQSGEILPSSIISLIISGGYLVFFALIKLLSSGGGSSSGRSWSSTSGRSTWSSSSSSSSSSSWSGGGGSFGGGGASGSW